MNTTHALTRKQLREVEGELLRERARLERTLASETETNGSTELRAFTPRAPVAAEGGLAVALETRTHARYGAVLGALTRLATGTYAICVSCSNRIPYERLIVMPETTRCVACGSRA
jgi:DnaK suppressor protein